MPNHFLLFFSLVQLALLAASSTASSVAKVYNYEILQGAAIGNSNQSTAVAQTDSVGLCAHSCSINNCNSAQYSESTGLCTTTFACGLNFVYPDSSKTTLIRSNYYKVSNLPMPMFDFMMTDVCGLVNTGWSNPGAYMTQPTFNPIYSVPVSSKFGKAIRYQNYGGQGSLSTQVNATLDLSKSFTFFAYFIAYRSQTNTCFLEITKGYTYNHTAWGPQFWYYNDGLSYDFQAAGCIGQCFDYYRYNSPLNNWTHVALVYNATDLRFRLYTNGTCVYNSTMITFKSSSYDFNYILTVARPNYYGMLDGTTYCLKIFQAALSGEDLKTVANSCLSPTMSIFT